MTDENVASGAGSHATANGDSPRVQQPPGRRRWSEVLMHRWPTVLGVAVAALTAFDLQVDAGFVSSISAVVVLMALVYIGAAALDRRRASWAVLLAGLLPALFIPATSGINPSVILLAAAAAFLVVGVARGQLRRPGGLMLQGAGVLAFGSTALAALFVAPELDAYLVAFALLGHAGWDAYHYLRDRVVVRSYAEFCGVLDLLVGVAILVMA
jgi:putative effector of murein hydrolase LrgA (UPF0299 family)